MQLRVWWIPQVPMEPFRYPVSSIEEGKLLLNALADYDLFQLNNKIKSDFCNTGGLETVDKDGTWVEWQDEEGQSI